MLEYEIAPNLKAFTHGFFKRKGGVSKGIYNSLNCGMSSKDKKDNVINMRTDGTESRQFLYAEDACEALLTLSKNFNPE